MDIRKKFTEETKKKISVTVTFDCDEDATELKVDVWSDEYIFWLEQQTEKLFAIPVVSNNEVEYCECGNPTLGTSVSRCGTCNKWFKAI